MKNTGSKFDPLEVPSQRPPAHKTAKKIAIEAARFGNSKKAENIVIYKLGKNSSLADYMVLMSADSVPQLEAVEEAVNKAFKAQGLFALYKEGGSSRAWKVLDYGGVLVHIFETRAREFYSIDQLYASCARIPWRRGAGRLKKPVKKRKERTAVTSNSQSLVRLRRMARKTAGPKLKLMAAKKAGAKAAAKKKK